MIRLLPHPKLLACLATFLLAGYAHGLIVFGNKTETDNTRNVIDPTNPSTYPSGNATGVPWTHAIRYGLSNASGVYLGNGYLLTARHVGDENSNLQINGQMFSRDTSYTSVMISLPTANGTQHVDLKLERLLGDPGLPPVSIIRPGMQDLSAFSVITAWGVGKGTIVPNQGWNWGNSTTRAFRWGTNVTTNDAPTISYGLGGNITASFASLRTLFNSNQGPDEAAGAMGDSGSPLWQKHGTDWFLAGITVTVSRMNASYYDSNTLLPGDQSPDATFFVRLSSLSQLFRFDAWKEFYEIPQDTAPDSDFDGDGVPLLLEYALGMSPLEPSREGYPSPLVQDGNLVVDFQRLATTTDVQLIWETSTTLEAGSWQQATPAVQTLDDTTVVRQQRATFPIPEGQNLFVRLRAELLIPAQ